MRSLPKLQSLDQIFVPASPLTGKVQMEFDRSRWPATAAARKAAR